MAREKEIEEASWSWMGHKDILPGMETGLVEALS
jgi:hypothetical protein